MEISRLIKNIPLLDRIVKVKNRRMTGVVFYFRRSSG
jgi:hypothetical protein